MLNFIVGVLTAIAFLVTSALLAVEVSESGDPLIIRMLALFSGASLLMFLGNTADGITSRIEEAMANLAGKPAKKEGEK